MKNKTTLKGAVIIMFAVLIGAVCIVPVAARLPAPTPTPVPANDGDIGGSFNSNTAAPVVTSITPSTQSLDPVPDGTATATVTIAIASHNGISDVASANVVLIDALGHKVGSQQVSQIQQDDSSANTGTCTATVSFPYYWQAGTYTIAVTATNNEGAVSPSSVATVTYTGAMGLTVDTPNLDFGHLGYGDVSSPQMGTVHNSANTPLDIAASADDWQSASGGSAIPATSLHAAFSSGTGSATGASDVAMPVDALVHGLSVNDGTNAGSANMAFTEHIPQYDASTFNSMNGQYTTDISLTASASAA